MWPSRTHLYLAAAAATTVSSAGLPFKVRLCIAARNFALTRREGPCACSHAFSHFRTNHVCHVCHIGWPLYGPFPGNLTPGRTANCETFVRNFLFGTLKLAARSFSQNCTNSNTLDCILDVNRLKDSSCQYIYTSNQSR